MTLPNFFIAGGARCGSTSLHAYCNTHPQIFMSGIKEPQYFSYGYGGVAFAGPGRQKSYETSIRDMATYRKLFRDAGDALAIGEASINYMLHPEACAGIRAEIPDARLVFILRHPVERAWSSFHRSRNERTELEPDFLTAWRDDERRRAAGHLSNVHRYKSLYGQHLPIWFDTFPRDQIKVILFDDFKADAPTVMRDLFGFLGVDPDFQPDTSKALNQGGEIANPALRFMWLHTHGLRAALVPHLPLAWRGKVFGLIARSKHRPPQARIPPALKAELTHELRTDILRLQDLIDRDLSHWLVPDSA